MSISSGGRVGGIEGHKGLGRARAERMHRARQPLLAHAAFAREHHRDLRARGLAHQLGGAAHAARQTHPFGRVVTRCERGAQRIDLGLQIFDAHQHRLRVVVARKLLAVRPGVDGAAFDAAMLVAAAAALQLSVDDTLAHEGADVARGVADQHPAHRLILRAEIAQVGLDLPGVIPAHAAQVMAGFDVHLEGFDRDLHRTLQHVQLRPHRELIDHRWPAAAPGAPAPRHAGPTHNPCA